MKKAITFLLALILLLSLTACGARKAPAEVSEPDKNAVVVAISTAIETLDPVQGWGHGNLPLIQSTLLRYDEKRDLICDLATDYEASDDQLIWTFTLREDAFFTDGEPVTAEDVAFTFEKVKAAGTAADLTVLSSVETPDDYTVEFHLSEPSSIFLNTAASVGIVPAHAYGDDYGVNPMGSGPWKFVQFNPQEQLILQANEDYYGEIPSIQTVTVVFMDEDAAFAAVQAGQVDVALTAATIARENMEGYTLQRVSTIDNRGFTLPLQPNTGELTESGYPMGNNVTCHKEIRQAMAYALDRELLAEVAVNGYATPCYSENDGMPWNNPETAIETDVAYAKQLLTDGGWADTDGDGILEKDNVKAEIHALYPSGDSVRQAIGMAAAEQLREIGIALTVEGSSWDDISKRMFSEAVIMGWGAATPAESYYLYQSQAAWQDDYYNPEGYQSETTDGYFKAALNAATVDAAYENWQLAQWDGQTGTSMKGECPWVWMLNVDHLYYVRNGLSIGEQGLHPHGASYPLLSNLHQWHWN